MQGADFGQRHSAVYVVGRFRSFSRSLSAVCYHQLDGLPPYKWTLEKPANGRYYNLQMDADKTGRRRDH